MLVLTRKRYESIVIGEEIALEDNVIVSIVDIGENKVRLGIQAPKKVSVHRREVYDAIQEENSYAAQLDIGGLEKGVGEIQTSNQPNAYQEFRKFLANGDYFRAYEIFNGNRDLPNRDELCQLICGLRTKLLPHE